MRAWVMTGMGAMLLAGPVVAQRTLPYYGSIAAGKARMRVGPGREYPSSWLYQRADLPVKIVVVYKGWKKIEDPAGTQGWMQANLVSELRTAVVLDHIVELRDTPYAGGRVQWRAEPGVVGRLTQCNKGWCHFDARGRGGYVQASQVWGVVPDEVFN